LECVAIESASRYTIFVKITRYASAGLTPLQRGLFVWLALIEVRIIKASSLAGNDEELAALLVKMKK
jgi:hypothetical protein